MERLPKEVLEQVFFHLPLTYLVRCLAVCTQWKHLLSSPHFLNHYYSTASRENNSSSYSWVALVHERHPGTIHPRPSPLHIYDPHLHKFLQLDLSFAPSPFTIPVPASQGLLCLSSLVERDFLCLCNPLTKSCKILPQLEKPVLNPLVFVVEGPGIESRKILVITDELQALYTAEHNRWVNFGADTRRRLRNAVIASNGLIYGVEDEGYGWNPSWRLVCSEINGGSCWKPVGHNWGDMSDVLKGPCLIRGRGDCFFMAGGLKSSLSLNSTCSTFVILEFDLNTLEWNEAGRMPAEFFRHFDPQCEFSILGGKEGVYFSGRKVGRLVFWDAYKECWSWMDDCDLDTSNALCGGFVFEPRLDVVP